MSGIRRGWGQSLQGQVETGLVASKRRQKMSGHSDINQLTQKKKLASALLSTASEQTRGGESKSLIFGG